MYIINKYDFYDSGDAYEIGYAIKYIFLKSVGYVKDGSRKYLTYMSCLPRWQYIAVVFTQYDNNVWDQGINICLPGGRTSWTKCRFLSTAEIKYIIDTIIGDQQRIERLIHAAGMSSDLLTVLRYLPTHKY